MSARPAVKKADPAPATVGRWEPRPEGTPLDTDVLALRCAILKDHPHCGLDFLRWILSPENPAGPGFAVTLQREGRLLGFGALSPRQARLDGRDVPVAFGFDYMVDRAIGATSSGRYAVRVARQWNQLAAEAGYVFAISYPNANAQSLLLSRHVGWRAVGSPRLLVRPLRGSLRGQGGTGRLRALALGTAAAVEDAALVIAATLRGRRSVGEIRPLRFDDPGDRVAMDRLWARRRDDRRVSFVRDAANLHWRYGRHPIHRYEVSGLFGPDGLSALIVTCHREVEGMPALLVVDALLDPERIEDSALLLTDALRRGAQAKAIIAAAEAMPDSALSRALVRAGFLAVPRRFDPKPFVLTMCDYAPTGAGEVQARDWAFAWGDIDVV